MPSEIHTVFAIRKSVTDTREYRYIVLENGLKAILISSLKPGEEAPDEDEMDGNGSADACDERGDDSSSEDEDDIANHTGLNEGMNEMQSGAALCVEIGSFSDPLEAQGLSHFLEHMVFMGSRKYPTENDFDAYLAKRGGRSNAWTANEHTLFYFDVNRPHFSQTLDRFANFFIDPLLNEDSIDREMTAVHSEYEMANTADSTRMEHFISSLAHSDSPFRHFGYGNFKSLKELPEENGTNIYTLLKDYRIQHYTAHRMTLAVQSKDSLDHLEELVRRIFSHIPNSGIPSPDFSKFSDSFECPSFRKLYKVCPLHDKEKLRIVWSLPCLRPFYKSSPSELISSLVGHEGEGSILALLREKSLATALTAGIPYTCDFQNSSICALFIIVISLTEKGLEEVDEVCSLVFQYLRLLLTAAQYSLAHPQDDEMVLDAVTGRRQRSFASYIPEYQLNCQAAFTYMEPNEAQDTVVEIAQMLQLVPPEEVYSAYSVLEKMDLKLYVRVLELLKPNLASIYLLSSTLAGRIGGPENWKVEPWFGVHYVCEDIPETTMKRWIEAEPSTKLHLPNPNRFLTKNFDILPLDNDMKQPIDLNARSDRDSVKRRRYGELWFQQRTKFRVPKARAIMHLWSDRVSQSKESVLSHVLFNYCINQSLSTIVYEAGEANLSYGVEFTENGLSIAVWGFNDKLFYLYSTILDHVLEDLAGLGQAQFEAYRESIRKLYINELLQPNILNSNLLSYLLRKDTYLLNDLLSALQTISIADILAHKQRFFARLRLTAFVHGNMTAEEAIQFFDCTIEKTKCSPLPFRKFSDFICLEPGNYRVRVLNCNPSDVNTCLTRVHLLNECSLEKDTLNQLIAYILSEPAYNYLRTKETLGYDVSLYRWRCPPGGALHSGIKIAVCSQSSQFSAGHVAGRLTAFWRRIAPRILASMDAEAFRTAVDSLIAVNQLEDVNMSVEAGRNWEEILHGTLVFDRREETVKILRKLKQEDVMKFLLEEYFDPKCQRSILVQVDAEPDQAASRPKNSYNINVLPVKLDAKSVAEEEASCAQVDPMAALLACAIHVQPDAKLKLSTAVADIPDVEAVHNIDNIRTFRLRQKLIPGNQV